MSKEAQSRIKINKLLEAAGWRFFDTDEGKANIALEPKVKLTQAQVDGMGNDFEAASNGFIDFLLLGGLAARLRDGGLVARTPVRRGHDVTSLVRGVARAGA